MLICKLTIFLNQKVFNDDGKYVGLCGLGMSIAVTIIQMMNGYVQVESELNKGSKFTVIIFLELQDIDEKFTSNLAENSSQNQIQKPTSLGDTLHQFSENDFQSNPRT